MLLKFTKHNGGSLYIRAEDLRSITDMPAWEHPQGLKEEARTFVSWVEGDTRLEQAITGTADENFERLRADELRMVEEHEQRRVQAMRNAPMPLPLPAVPRGKPRG